MNYLIKYAKYSANMLLWLVILLLVIFAAPKIIILALPFILGWIMAMIANPLVRWMNKKFKVPRKLSSAIIIVLIFALFALVIYLAVSKLVSEATGFLSQFPSMYAGISEDIARIQKNIEQALNSFPKDIHHAAQDIINNFSGWLLDSLQKIGQPTIEAAGSFAKNIPSVLIATLITIMSAYFMIADKEKISKFIASHFSRDTKAHVRKITKGMRNILSGYFKAQIIILGFVSIILFIGFWILDVKFALLFSLLIALLDFLPFFGTGTALGPWALFHFLSGDYKMAIGLVVIYFVSQLARRIIEPKVIGETIGMNPLLTMVLMYAGYKLIGVVGLIFAAPVGMLFINMDKQGLFDNFKFILKDIYHDFSKLRDIEEYRRKNNDF